MKFKTKHFHILLIVLFTFVIYSNTFFNGFVFDDEFFIVDNFEMRSLKNIPSYFSEPSVGNLYRPVRSVLYSVTFFFWKLNPFGYHLNAIILHLLISVVVYLILSELVSGKRISLIASLLFVVHPIHTARVANMTGGFDLLGILFLFLAFYNYILFRKYGNKKAFVYSIILFVIGLFSSEEVVVFPILALLYDFCFSGGKISNVFRKLKSFWVYIVSLLFYFAIRLSVLGQIGRAEVYFLGNLQTRILSTLVIFVRYIYILLFPFRLTVDYYVQVYKSFSLSVIFALFLFLIVFFFWIKSYKNNKIAFFSIGWFFVALIPFSNLFPVHSFMADRYLYVASFGFVTLLVYLLDKFFNLKFFDKKIFKLTYIIVIVCLIVVYSFVTVARNSEWRNEQILLSKAVQRQPKSSNAHNDLGQVYFEMGLYSEAFKEYNQAILLNDKNHLAWLNIGTLYGEVGNYSEAVYYIDQSLLIFESYKAYNNLGLMYNNLGDSNQAVVELKKAIEFNPYLSKAYMDLGVVYAGMEEFDKAYVELNNALEINPRVADIHYNLGILHEFLGQKDDAKREFAIASALSRE
jgi:protein O-mannosyl-transferase